MRKDSALAQHPDRDEIIQRMLQGTESLRKIAEEKGIKYQALCAAKRTLKKNLGNAVLQQLPSATPPPRSPKKDIDNLLGARALIGELSTIKDRLEYEYMHRDAKAATRLSALDKQIKVVAELIRMAELSERHHSRDVRTAPEYQRLEKAIAVVMRSHPETAATFRREYDRLQPVTAPDEEGVTDV